MKGLYAIYRKEMGHYFVSPVAYIIVGVFLFLCSYFFTRLLTAVIENSLEASMSGAGGAIRRPLHRGAVFLRDGIDDPAFFDADADHGRLFRGAQARHHGNVDDLAGER